MVDGALSILGVCLLGVCGTMPCVVMVFKQPKSSRFAQLFIAEYGSSVDRFRGAEDLCRTGLTCMRVPSLMVSLFIR